MVRQTIKDTGPLDRRQMKMVDEVFLDRAKQFILQRHAAGKTRLT